MNQTHSSKHALVIGGSMAGLLAARVLADFCDRVTVIERDSLPESPKARPGVPQSSQLHLLLNRGRDILERLFPDLEAAIAQQNIAPLFCTQELAVLGPSGWLPGRPSEIKSYSCTRPMLEWLVRQQLQQWSNVHIVDECQVEELCLDETRSRVSGVRLRFQKTVPSGPWIAIAEGSDKERFCAADWVVDASGRRSLVPHWLEQLGYQPPAETRVTPFIGYASCQYQTPPAFQVAHPGFLIMAVPPHQRRGGCAMQIEGAPGASGQRWLVTLTGTGKDYPPTEEGRLLEFARSLRSPVLYDLMRQGERVTPITGYRRMENLRRHYESLKAFPQGLLVTGDSACAFNPIYGQGMSVAALDAVLLQRCFAEAQRTGRWDRLGDRFRRQLAQEIAVPWMLATGEDSRWATTQGAQVSPITRWSQRYLDEVWSAAVGNPEITLRLFSVLHMWAPPTDLFHPRVMGPVLRHALRGLVRRPDSEAIAPPSLNSLGH